MHKSVIRGLARAAGSGSYLIYHAKRKTMYHVIGYIQIDIGGKWVEHIQYTDIETGKAYARQADCFGNFWVPLGWNNGKV